MDNGYEEKKDVKPNELRVVLLCDTEAFEAALASLTEIAKASPQIIQRFLDGLDSASQLVRVDSDAALAARASERWIKLQPSDLLIEFLATCGAGECNGLQI